MCGIAEKILKRSFLLLHCLCELLLWILLYCNYYRDYDSHYACVINYFKLFDPESF